MKTYRVGLVGISGYAGMEAARLLVGHPALRLVMACSRAEAGRRLGEFYPFLEKLPGADVIISVFEPEEVAKNCDIVFLAVPAGKAMEMTVPLLAAGTKVVDFSADFRLKNPQIYEEWYNQPHTARNLLKEAVYGIPELYAEQIAAARLVANPGCYPTCAILGLYAALQNDLIESEGIIVDAKSGTSGAGRTAAVRTLFCEVADTFRAYNLPRHRHTPEIEQEVAFLAGREIRLSFNPHLVPMNRGIFSTIYATLKNPHLSTDDACRFFAQTWEGSRWIRVLPKGSLPETRYVRGGMFCDISVLADQRTGRLIVLSVIDNLCRGAAGQAIANANLMCGLPLETGLISAPAV